MRVRDRAINFIGVSSIYLCMLLLILLLMLKKKKVISFLSTTIIEIKNQTSNFKEY